MCILTEVDELMADTECISNIMEVLVDEVGTDAPLDVQSDDDDLYAGLQCEAACDDGAGGTIVHRLQQQQIKELQETVAKKDEQISVMQQQLEAKDTEVQQLSAERLVLLTNISSLFKTAQAEIKRHATQLQASRLEVVQLKAQLARTHQQPKKQHQQQQQQQQPKKQHQQQQQQDQHQQGRQTQHGHHKQQQKQQPQQQQQQQHKNYGTPVGDTAANCKNQSTQQQQQQQQQRGGNPPPQLQQQQQQQQHGQHGTGGTHAGTKRSRSCSPFCGNSSGSTTHAAEAAAAAAAQQRQPSCVEHTDPAGSKRIRTRSNSPDRNAAVPAADKQHSIHDRQQQQQHHHHSSGSSKLGSSSGCRMGITDRDRKASGRDMGRNWDSSRRDRDGGVRCRDRSPDRDRDRDGSGQGRDRSPYRERDRDGSGRGRDRSPFRGRDDSGRGRARHRDMHSDRQERRQ